MGTTKVTRNATYKYKEGCSLDLVLSPLYWWILGINYIIFNTQITFNLLYMLIEIWLSNIKATYEKENINLCLFPFCLSVTTFPPHYTPILRNGLSMLPSLSQSHPHTTLIFFIHLNNIFTEINISIVLGFIRFF